MEEEKGMKAPDSSTGILSGAQVHPLGSAVKDAFGSATRSGFQS